MGTVLWVILAIVIIAILVAVCLFGGDLINLMLPKNYAQVGDSIDIFLDGVYDRTATISGIKSNVIFIYGSLPLPLKYRGKFYGVGSDSNGVRFWYVKRRMQYRLIPFAEKMRMIFHTQSDPFQLAPVYAEGADENMNVVIGGGSESEAGEAGEEE